MKFIVYSMLCLSLLNGDWISAQEKEIPEPLQPWEEWATWGDSHKSCPTPYNAAGEHICFWPSRLDLLVDSSGGTWEIEVEVFSESWVPLPGNREHWPMAVQVEGTPIAVLERDEVPTVKLEAGKHKLSGQFRWDVMPQKIAIPKQVGIVSLTAEGQQVASPSWDADGDLWVRRLRAQPADEDHLSVEVYRLLADGIPLWLHTKVELTVSGKSREETIGSILPEGWQLSQVESPIPVAIDDQGQLKAQVRSGKWTVDIRAFRTSSPEEIRFAADAEPAVDKELIGYRGTPRLRIAEIEGLLPVDVSQTTFPEEWRDVPVYSWSTENPFRIAQKMRGFDIQVPEGLSFERQLWLDETGGGFTYLDKIRGTMQQIWRLDVADDQDLGAVRVNGEAQLITTNPKTGAEGVEVRTRNLNLDAVGRIPRTDDLSVTSWQSDADSVGVTLSLPPGWRVLAVFGADSVDGDWLTAWSLLDLFLLLIFSLAVGKMWGFPAGVVAFLAFGLAYHEPYSPRYTWLFLLIPLALLRVTPEGAARRRIKVWKYFAAALLILNLVPFLARQVQGVIYPQLEQSGMNYRTRTVFWWWGDAFREGMRSMDGAAYGTSMFESAPAKMAGRKLSNLQYDPNAKIQTGPAVPEWDWNYVRCGWSSPVSADQRFKPIFISLTVHRALTVVRVMFLVGLAAILFGVRSMSIPFSRRTAAASVALFVLLLPGQSYAQFPDSEMLNSLRARLLEPSDAYPHAADIPEATLKLTGNRFSLELDIHAALDVAVPLPGRLPAWSPLSVQFDEADAAICRREGFLWVTVPKGVHHLTVEGLLGDISDWELAFPLKPRHLSIEAPDWNVVGLGRDGVPEQQVIISRQREVAPGEATYDQKNYQAVVAVERRLEVGLVWKVNTQVTRLSAPGNAVSLQIPLLAGEKVLTSDAEVNSGTMAVRLGAHQQRVTWESELPVGEPVRLQAAATDDWVERWQLVTSPVWNVAFDGLAPIFEADQENMIPAWYPFPGEEVTLSFSRPEAIQGDTITVRSVEHSVSLGSRQRTMNLKMEIQCSVAGDFVLEIDPEAEVTSLKQDSRVLPVRLNEGQLIIPLHPGNQTVEVVLRKAEPLQTISSVAPIGIPVDGSNVTTMMRVPENRWVLWAHGPQMGPAVRFWTVLICAVLAAIVLGYLPHSPLRRYEWVLLALGLTQVHILAALWVVAWLFVLAWRGRQEPGGMRNWRFDFLQLCLVFFTIVALCILVTVVSKGLLGNPEMFILGNGSWRTNLQWYQGRVGQSLPEPYIFSISVWFYRLLMLFWALWLASALLRWLRWGWTQFTHGGGWKHIFKRKQSPEIQGAS